MRAILDFIRPPEDAEWKHVNRWRWNVTLTLLVLAGGCGWAYGPKGFAWANDMDTKIDSKLKPVVESQQRTDAKVDKLSVLILEQLASKTAADIRLNISTRCRTPVADQRKRDELWVEKERLQDQYEAYKGKRAPEPSCADL